MKTEYKEAAVLIGAVLLAIYLSSQRDKVLNSSVSDNPTKIGEKGGFENWTEDDITYDDHLYKNADGLKGLKLK